MTLPDQPTHHDSKGASDDEKVPGLVAVDDGDDKRITDNEQRQEEDSDPSVLVVNNENSSRRTRIRAWIVKTLQRYVQFIASAVNQDKGIKFLQYTLWLASKLHAKDSDGCQGLVKLSSELSMARYVTRLLQFPTALEAIATKSWTSSSARFPNTFAVLGDLLAWSMAVYYPAEHVAYLQWTAPQWLLPPSPVKQPLSRSAEQWSAWSCRGWLVYTIAEMVQGALQWKEKKEQQREEQWQQEVNAKDGTCKKEGEEERITQRTLQNIQLQFTRNALFLLPAIQYSLPNWDRDPWLPPDLINLLFWLESAVCLYQASV